MLSMTCAMTNRTHLAFGIPSRSQVESVAIKPRLFGLGGNVINHPTPVDPALSRH